MPMEMPDALGCGSSALLLGAHTFFAAGRYDTDGRADNSLRSASAGFCENRRKCGSVGHFGKATADNFHLSLGTEVSAEAHEAGSTEVTFYLFDKVPVKTVSANVLPDTRLIPCGRTVGVQMDTDGLLVLGTGFVEDAEGNKTEPCKGILQTGRFDSVCGW